MKSLDEIIRKIKGEEIDPWKDYDPDAPMNPQPTEADFEETMKKAYRPKVSPSYMLMVKQGFILLWILGHIVPLYVSIGTPIASGILIYVLVDVVIFIHYYILLRKIGEKHE